MCVNHGLGTRAEVAYERISSTWSSVRSRGPARSKPEPESSEKVERPVAVAADERDRQEVEEAPEVPLDAVPRAPVLARTVVDGQLGDAVSAVVGEHRN